MWEGSIQKRNQQLFLSFVQHDATFQKGELVISSKACEKKGVLDQNMGLFQCYLM